MEHDRSTGHTGDPAFGTPATGTGEPMSGLQRASEANDPGTRAGSYDRKFVGDDGDTGGLEDRLEEGKERISDAVDSGKERVGSAFESGKNRVAGQLESVGDRLEERGHQMEQRGGVQARAGQAALRASDALDSSADYLRTHDPAEMRDDLEHAIRERPLLSVGLAAGVGFLLARIIRD
jgi:ElaB/YqjD/DUF883 family membrane-anchored ribosome-binding protein